MRKLSTVSYVIYLLQFYLSTVIPFLFLTNVLHLLFFLFLFFYSPVFGGEGGGGVGGDKKLLICLVKQTKIT